MTEYISRELAMDKIGKMYYWCGYEYKCDEFVSRKNIENIPAADVVEVKHGHWFLLDECSNAGVYCSECHKKVYKEHYANVKPKSKFCPNCGAIMDEEFVKL